MTSGGPTMSVPPPVATGPGPTSGQVSYPPSPSLPNIPGLGGIGGTLGDVVRTGVGMSRNLPQGQPAAAPGPGSQRRAARRGQIQDLADTGAIDLGGMSARQWNRANRGADLDAMERSVSRPGYGGGPVARQHGIEIFKENNLSQLEYLIEEELSRYW